MIFFKAVIIWLVMIITESLNGTIREFWLVPALGDTLAHHISFITGAMLILGIATLFIPWLQESRSIPLIRVGFLWLILTVGFEVALGRMIFGYSWERIAADYNLFQGGLMSIGLVLLLLAPLIATKVREILGRSTHMNRAASQ